MEECLVSVLTSWAGALADTFPAYLLQKEGTIECLVELTANAAVQIEEALGAVVRALDTQWSQLCLIRILWELSTYYRETILVENFNDYSVQDVRT